MKSLSVAIQMKAIAQYFPMVLLAFYGFLQVKTNEKVVKFFLWPF